ncbi:MAG: hypothetical protein AAGF12_07250 [Myxococcota bacterium]
MFAACGGSSAEPSRTPPTPVTVPSEAVVAEPEPSVAPVEASMMDLETLDRILREEATLVRREANVWEAVVDGVQVAMVTDTRADRMRIVAPVAAEADLTDELRRIILEANFHSALDARYATSGGILYAAYIHPLSPLEEAQFRSALHQVASLKLTFGTTYSSSDLVFGG